MATRINMMKLLQEVRGLAEMANRRPLSRPPAPLILQFRAEGRKMMAQRKNIQVQMLDLPDIPNPVKITHRPGRARRNRTVQ